MNQTPLIYIAGSGHSGSTLLELFLSGADGHVGLGEIFQLVDRRNSIIHALDGHLCSCGALVVDCPFWGGIIPSLREIPHAEDEARYTRLGNEFEAFFGRGKVMIDSSKSPVGLERAAASKRFDIRVLHLVRDVRSWLVSTRKSYRRNGVATLASNRQRYGMLKGTVKYILRNPFLDAHRWCLLNTEVERVVVRYGLPMLPVSYERLCFDTAAVQQDIETFIGAPIASYGMPGTRIDNHSIFGNRMRFEPEKLNSIRYDDGWFYDDLWLMPYMMMPRLRRLNRRFVQR